MTTKIGINGFGRIGRCVARILYGQPQSDFEIVGINDLTDASMLAHLLQFDSVHREFSRTVTAKDGMLVLGDARIPVRAERDPANIPWKEWGAEIVLECTGVFRNKDTAAPHLEAGAERVIISAPATDPDGSTDVVRTSNTGNRPVGRRWLPRR